MTVRLDRRGGALLPLVADDGAVYLVDSAADVVELVNRLLPAWTDAEARRHLGRWEVDDDADEVLELLGADYRAAAI